MQQSNSFKPNKLYRLIRIR